MPAMPSFGLVLDLSHTGFAAVLSSDGEEVLASEVRHGGTRHDDLGDWLEGLLKQAGAGAADSSRASAVWKDVAWICVGLGPGSFTGIRIAMAFAQGVALPQKIPLFGFTSFEALFLSFPGTGHDPIHGPVAAVAANSGRFYLARSIDDPGVLTTKEDVDQGNRPVLLPDDHWDFVRIARHAREFDGGRGRDARKPYYLQLSAAEDKAVSDKATADKAASDKAAADAALSALP